MAKFIGIIEIDTGDGEHNLVAVSDAIDALGDHITPEVFHNVDCIERHDSVRVSKKIWGHDDTYQVIEHQVSAREGTYFHMILLPGEDPFRRR